MNQPAQPQAPAYLFVWICYRTADQAKAASRELLEGRAGLLTAEQRPAYIIDEPARWGTLSAESRPMYIIDDTFRTKLVKAQLDGDSGAQPRPSYVIDETGLAHLPVFGTLNVRMGLIAKDPPDDSGEFRAYMLPIGTTEDEAKQWINGPEAVSFAKTASVLMRVQVKLR